MAEPVLIPSLMILGAVPFPHTPCSFIPVLFSVQKVLFLILFGVHIAGDSCCDIYVKPGEVNTVCIPNEVYGRITG